jgi:ATP-dependent exoDNAse (exonuclease V) alpha subunit
MKDLVKTWHSEKQNDLKTSIILAGTKAEVSKLNRYCQAMRINNHELKEKTVAVQNGKIFENDRVLFTKNNRIYKVNNGDLGTVTEVSSLNREIKVKLDSGKDVIIPLTKYEEVQLGYAVTTHKAQGVTIDKAYILAGGIMQDRELSYVQMSRSRVETKIFIDKGEEGQTVKDLAKNMSRSRQKEIALDKVLSSEDQKINQGIKI